MNRRAKRRGSPERFIRVVNQQLMNQQYKRQPVQIPDRISPCAVYPAYFEPEWMIWP
ncbi:hypothetical protein ACFL5Z_12105 [Planctomycetota bacterium]